MARSMRSKLRHLVAVIAAAAPAVLCAQVRVIRVVSSDGQPIPYANVSVEGGQTQITDEKGDVSLGAGKHQTLTLNIRRIGYTPWFGKLELPDTAAVLTVTLPRLAQTLAPVTVNGREIKSPLALTGFYDRWLMRQKGVLSATFIGPEEIEFRHPDKITNMLYGVNGIHVSRACVMPGDPHRCVMGLVAFNNGQNCAMTIVIDGQQQHPSKGAGVDINMLLDASDVAAIEVYARGGNMPVGFQFQDTGCGVVAFWTGSRRQ